MARERLGAPVAHAPDHDEHAQDRVVLVLEVLVPHARSVPIDLPDMQLLLTPWCQGPSFAARQWSDLHPTTALAFQLLGDFSYEADARHVHSLRIFTDGSAGSGGMSWALIVIWRLRCGAHRYGGHFSGVIGDNEFGGFVTDDRACGNNVAELTAIVWALLFVAQCSFAHQAPIAHILSDSMLALAVVEGRAVPSKMKQLGTRARLIMSSLRAMGRHVSTSHVPGHRGHPWNELADVAASAAADRKGVHTPPASVATVVSHAQFEWAIPCRFSATRAVEFPPLVDGKLILGAPGTQLVVPELPMVEARVPHFQRREHAQPERLVANMVLVGINVNTLNSKAEVAGGLRLPGKAALLQNQLQAIGATLIGVQETRAAGQGRWSTEHYHVLSGGCDAAGHGGCQLWLAKSVSAGTQDIKIDASGLTFLYADHRRLFATVQIGQLVVHVAVFHALDSSYTEQQQSDWWEVTTSLSERLLLNREVIAFIDANGRLGSVASSAVGDVHEDQEDHAGRQCHEFLLHRDMAVPATFLQHPADKSATWCSRTGAWHRIDYVAIPQHRMALCERASTLPDMDMFAAKQDHVPVMVEMRLPLSRDTAALPRRCPRIDTSSLDDPQVRAAIERELGAMPLVPWSVDAHSHYAFLVQHVVQVFKRYAPPPNRARRKPWFSAATNWILDQRAALTKFLKQTRAQRGRARLSVCFRAWKAGFVAEALTREVAHRDFVLTMYMAAAVKARDQSMKPLKDSLMVDRRELLHAVASEAARCTEAGDTKGLYRALAKLKPYAPRAPHGVIDEEGRPQHTPQDVRQYWFRHFVNLQQGQEVVFSDLLHDTRERQASEYASSAVEADILAYVPTLSDLEHRFRMLKPGKAPGEDMISASVCKNFAAVMASLVAPVVAKACFRGEEPLYWKGTAAFELYKGRGPVMASSSYRCINVASTVGNVVHRSLRSRAMPALMGYASQMQQGGLPGRGTDFAALFVRLHQERAAARKLALGILFLDVVAAFDMLRRPHVLGDESGTGILEQTGMPRALRAMLRESMLGTWLSVRGTESLATSTRGSRAGTSLGDFWYVLLMAKVTKVIKARLQEQGLLEEVQWDKRTSLLPVSAATEPVDATSVSFVDDDTFVFSAPTTHVLMERMGRAVPIIIEAYREYDLPLNFCPGKTSLLLHLRGTGADKYRRKIFIDDAAQVSFECSHGSVCVPVVSSYKHMGGMLSTEANPAAEAHNRATSMWIAARPLMHKVLANRDFKLEQRMGILRSLMLSRLFYNAGTWCYVSGTWMKPIKRRLQATYTSMAKAWRGDAVSRLPFKTVCEQLGAPTAEQQLAAARLRLWARLVRHGPPVLHALVQSAADQPWSWARRVMCDLVVLHRASGKLSELPPPQADLEPWCAFVQNHPAAWASIVAAHFMSFRADAHATKVPNAVPEPGVDPVVPGGLAEPLVVHQCQECHVHFGSRQALMAHRAHKHGYRRDEARYAVGEVCQFCMLLLHTRARLMGHFVKAPLCLQSHVQFFQPLSPEALQQLADAEAPDRAARRRRGVCDAKADVPAIPVHGPSIRPAAAVAPAG